LLNIADPVAVSEISPKTDTSYVYGYNEELEELMVATRKNKTIIETSNKFFSKGREGTHVLSKGEHRQAADHMWCAWDATPTTKQYDQPVPELLVGTWDTMQKAIADKSKKPAQPTDNKFHGKEFWHGEHTATGKKVRVLSKQDHVPIILIELAGQQAVCSTLSHWKNEDEAKTWMIELAKDYAKNKLTLDDAKAKKKDKAQQLVKERKAEAKKAEGALAATANAAPVVSPAPKPANAEAKPAKAKPPGKRSIASVSNTNASGSKLLSGAMSSHMPVFGWKDTPKGFQSQQPDTVMMPATGPQPKQEAAASSTTGHVPAEEPVVGLDAHLSVIPQSLEDEVEAICLA
jgi:hypothetical protein